MPCEQVLKTGVAAWVILGNIGWYWDYIGIILRLYWGYIGVILGLYWGYIWVMLGLQRSSNQHGPWCKAKFQAASIFSTTCERVEKASRYLVRKPLPSAQAMDIPGTILDDSPKTFFLLVFPWQVLSPQPLLFPREVTCMSSPPAVIIMPSPAMASVVTLLCRIDS